MRTELRELRFQIPQDYRDHTGKVIVRRGTVVEPLKVMPLTNGLLFIDGTDARQVEYAIRRSQSERLKIVLTAGSPYALRVKYAKVPWHGGRVFPLLRSTPNDHQHAVQAVQHPDQQCAGGNFPTRRQASRPVWYGGRKLKSFMRLWASVVLALCLSGNANAQALCNGSFPNLITDVCYDCIFPISIMGGFINMGVSGDDYDTGASHFPVCVCANNLAVGTPVSFWEPRYMVDTTTKPGCMPLLGGIDIKTPYNAAEYGAENVTNAAISGKRKAAFMQVNEYVNPIMSALGVVVNNPCLDNRSFDVPFLSWADPTWNDDALSLMLTPYAYPFAGIPSIAAELPDAISATFGFPMEILSGWPERGGRCTH